MSKLALAIANAIYDYKHGVIETHDQLYKQLHRDIDTTVVKVWREDKSIPLPKYGKEGDACCDVYAKSIEYDKELDRYVVHTGLHFALPQDYEMELRPRSSNTKTEYYISNTPMTLDWGYKGELLIIFKSRTSSYITKILNHLGNALEQIEKDVIANECNMSARVQYDKLLDLNRFPYKEGDRICQLLVRRREEIVWNEVETLEELGTSERGTGGFGSTGK